MATNTKKDGVKYISKKDFTGNLSRWAVRQSPYSCPDNLERVIIKADGAWPSDTIEREHHLKEWSHDEFEEFVHRFVYSTPEVISWNSAKSGRQGNSFVSAFGPLQAPEDDFIDLDALVRNVVNDCWKQDID
jgi:hypothetical protein